MSSANPTQVVIRQAAPPPPPVKPQYMYLGGHIWKVTVTSTHPDGKQYQHSPSPELVKTMQVAASQLLNNPSVHPTEAQKLIFLKKHKEPIEASVAYGSSRPSVKIPQPTEDTVLQSFSALGEQIEKTRQLGGSLLQEKATQTPSRSQAAFLSTEESVRKLADQSTYLQFDIHHPLLSCFSNAYLHPFSFETLSYCSAAAAFYAQKLPAKKRAPFQTMTAKEAYEKAQEVTNTKWDQEKENLMRKILKEKFQDTHFKNLLLATGSTYLACSENRDVDLGKILMEIRQELGGSGVQSKPADFP